MCKNLYVKTKGEKPFDWNKFLKLAISGKVQPGSEKHDDAVLLAGNWVTCACGNQCAIIPRADMDNCHTSLHEPLDGTLSDLGMEFYQTIKDSEFKVAKRVLAKIEERSAILIEIELTKQKLDALAKKANLVADIVVE